MDQQNVSPHTKSAEARNKRKLTCTKKGNVSKRPTRSKPLSDITSSTINRQINPISMPNSTNISSVANQTQYSQLNQNIQHPPTYGRRCVPGLNLLHKFDATLQPGPTADKSTNVANKRKTPDIPYVHNFPSSSIANINKRMLPTSITKSTGSKPLADITSSTLNTQINPTSKQNSNNIPDVGNHTQFSQQTLNTLPTTHTYGRRSVHGLNLLHKFDAVEQPGQTVTQIPNVVSKQKTPDIPDVYPIYFPSNKQLNQRILPASITKSTYQHVQSFNPSILKNPQRPRAAQNKSPSITQPCPIKSSTSNVGTNPKPSSSNFDCFAKGFLCRNSRNNHNKDNHPIVETVHQLKRPMVDNSSTTFMPSDAHVPNNIINTPTSNSDQGHGYRSSNFYIGETSNSTAKVRTKTTSIANDAEYFRSRPVHHNTAK